MKTRVIKEQHPAFDVRMLRGYDEAKHNSSVVTGSVEERGGEKVVVYRAIPELMQDINEEFRRRLLAKNSAPFRR